VILLRGLAIIVGLGAIAAVTYGTVEATGGIGANTAPLYIALGALQAAIALSFAVIHSRIVAALAILVLVACEAATFIATADLQLAGIEMRAAPAHEAQAKRKAAEDWVARLDRDDRIDRAERALRDAQADARSKSTAKDCGKGCIATLGKTVDDAGTAVAAAQSSLELERRQARAALDKSPLPPCPSPLADRLGVQASTLDLLFVGFRGFAVAAGAAIVLAIGAHGYRRAPEPVELASNVVSLTPKRALLVAKKPKSVPLPVKIGDVDAFLLERVTHEEGARVSWADAFLLYRAWCDGNGCSPVDAKAFGARLDALRAELGLKVRTRGQDVFFVGLKLAS
jgi:hypothetical protein